MASGNRDPATATDFVGVFATLVREHREASELLADLLGEPRDAPRLWPQVRAALVSHEQGEVRELFPVLRADAGLRELADHHDAEARFLDQLITKLDTLPMTSMAWLETATRLAATVREHVAEEESEMFPRAQQAIGEARAVEIDANYTDTKAKLLDAHRAPPRDSHDLLARA
jgi:Hemerythrin HHE cation binding domain